MTNVFDNPLNDSLSKFFNKGSLNENQVSVKIGGEEYTAFQSVSITKSMESVANYFTIATADRWREAGSEYGIRPSDPIMVGIGGKKVISGYVDQMQLTVQNDDRSISFSGRSKTGDLIDSAAIALETTYKNITLKDLALKYVDIFDIKVTDESDFASKLIEKVTVQPRETVMEMLTRYADERQVLLTTDYNGDLLITNREAKQLKITAGSTELGFSLLKKVGNPNGLYQGVNVLSAEASYDETSRFQNYIVVSQKKGTDNTSPKENTAIKAVATDEGMGRFRKKYIIAQKSMNKSQATQLAKWHANIGATNAARASVTVQGWRQSNGDLWDVNMLVDTDLTFIGFEKGEYLISEVTFSQSVSSGTTTTLSLVRADAYSIKEPRIEKDINKNGSGWGKDKFGAAFKEVAKSLGL